MRLGVFGDCDHCGRVLDDRIAYFRIGTTPRRLPLEDLLVDSAGGIPTVPEYHEVRLCSACGDVLRRASEEDPSRDLSVALRCVDADAAEPRGRVIDAIYGLHSLDVARDRTAFVTRVLAVAAEAQLVGLPAHAWTCLLQKDKSPDGLPCCQYARAHRMLRVFTDALEGYVAGGLFR